MIGKKNKIYLFYILFFLLFGCCINSASGAENWKLLKGDHFKIYYIEDRPFAEKTLDKAERYYQKIANDLGYARHGKFWTWSNRVKIYLYPDYHSYSDYIRKKGYAHWAEGIAKYKEKEIISYVKSDRFFDTILPHEITHLIFRDYVGRKNIPMWIDEGVAQWEEKNKKNFVDKKMRQLLQHHSLIPIERMMTLDITKIKNERIIELYYVQSVSLINFLIKEYGPDNFIFFCRYLRDGKKINEALKFSYPTTIRNVEKLRSKWLTYIEKK